MLAIGKFRLYLRIVFFRCLDFVADDRLAWSFARSEMESQLRTAIDTQDLEAVAEISKRMVPVCEIL